MSWFEITILNYFAITALVLVRLIFKRRLWEKSASRMVGSLIGAFTASLCWYPLLIGYLIVGMVKGEK